MVREKESWGVSPEITKVTRAVKLLADRNENVLLLGETGVGKSYIAKSLHEMGKRGKFDFLEIPCEAIGDGLPVADVFGNVEKNKTGLIGKVGRGSIYLKDIDELSPVLQNIEWISFTS
jgi:transcriptional regulator with PAS, ATPase and Fis domain